MPSEATTTSFIASGETNVIRIDSAITFSVKVRTSTGTVVTFDLAPGGEIAVTAGTDDVYVDMTDPALIKS